MNAIQPLRTLPVTLLNLGSGKDFRAEAFNIDIDDSWSPDAVLDLSAIDLADGGPTLATERFGRVTLHPGCFDRIMANDVLEHVPNLMKLMTTCLGLLRVGGTFEISVPYDLSFGAWQDPTHVRAFNERSWLYYTDWFWYMGWDKARFALDHLTFVPSPVGEEMQRRGLPRDVVLATPRAVDSMAVTLRKIELGPDDLRVWQHWRERRAKARAANFGAAAAAPAMPVASPVVAGPEPFPGAWSEHKDAHCVWIVSPKGYAHHHAFEEIAVGLGQAFADRGGSAPVVRHPSEWAGRKPIILGAHLLTPTMAMILPPGSVIFNLEQVDRSSAWVNEQYLGLMRRLPVLDYSLRNTAALASIGIGHARCLPLGYASGLTRIAPAPVQDIDVLFYGSINERRAAVIEELKARGVAVAHLFNVYGAERDAAIARAKLVLNMHFYEAGIFESARVVFLLANAACVVTEGQGDDPDLAPFAEGLAVCPYEGIVARCLALLADDDARRAQAARGFAAVSRFTQADRLAALAPSA